MLTAQHSFADIHSRSHLLLTQLHRRNAGLRQISYSEAFQELIASSLFEARVTGDCPAKIQASCKAMAPQNIQMMVRRLGWLGRRMELHAQSCELRRSGHCKLPLLPLHPDGVDPCCQIWSFLPVYYLYACIATIQDKDPIHF